MENNDNFYLPLVTSAQCTIGPENYPDAAILFNYNTDEYSQGSGQIKENFEALTENDIFQPYISDHDFRFPNEGNNVGYNIYVFDIRYQKIHSFSTN